MGFALKIKKKNKNKNAQSYFNSQLLVICNDALADSTTQQAADCITLRYRDVSPQLVRIGEDL